MEKSSEKSRKINLRKEKKRSLERLTTPPVGLEPTTS